MAFVFLWSRRRAPIISPTVPNRSRADPTRSRVSIFRHRTLRTSCNFQCNYTRTDCRFHQQNSRKHEACTPSAHPPTAAAALSSAAAGCPSGMSSACRRCTETTGDLRSDGDTGNRTVVACLSAAPAQQQKQQHERQHYYHHHHHHHHHQQHQQQPQQQHRNHVATKPPPRTPPPPPPPPPATAVTTAVGADPEALVGDRGSPHDRPRGPATRCPRTCGTATDGVRTTGKCTVLAAKGIMTTRQCVPPQLRCDEPVLHLAHKESLTRDA